MCLLIWKLFIQNDRKFQMQQTFFKVARHKILLQTLCNSFDFAPGFFCTKPSIPRLITFPTAVLDLRDSSAIPRIHISVPRENHTLRTSISELFSLRHFVSCPFKTVKEILCDTGYHISCYPICILVCNYSLAT